MNKDVQRFMPDQESFTLLTDLLRFLWPTACKVSICMDQWPVCLWPSTLVALCEWMQQKECLSVESLLHLARHSSRHLIRAIQVECLQKQPQLSFSRYMVQQVLAREPGCRGILEAQRKERRLATLTKGTVANQPEVQKRKKTGSAEKTTMQAEQPKNTGFNSSASTSSTEDDLDVVAFSNSGEMETFTEQTHDLLQLLTVTAPVAHPVAPCSSASVLPAEVVEPAPGAFTANVELVRRNSSRKRRAAADHGAQEGKKQKVLQWLEAVQ